MIVLRRTPFRKPGPPPRPAREWTGSLPTPRPIVAARPDSGLRLVAPVPKENAVRDKPWRMRVAALPCANCRVVGFSQAAHGPSLGRGIKATDADVFPLCCDRPGVVGCHVLFDTYRLCDREARHVWAARWAKETREALK